MPPHPALLRGAAVGSGGAPHDGRGRAPGGHRFPLVTRAAFPLLSALLAVGAVFAAGLTQRSLLGTALEDIFYGFFLDRYPLFLFAVVYGVARILIGAVLRPWGRLWLRGVGAPLGLLLFLAACLYPTFGGLALRAGFMAGGMAFINNLPMIVAYGLGAGTAALAFGLALGLARILARARLSPSWRALGRSLLSFLAIWFGALVLGAPRALSLEVAQGWPGGPLSPGAALAISALVALALLPHAMLAARSAAPGAKSDREPKLGSRG